MALIGGANLQGQVKRLRDQRPQIVIATPGRLGEIVFHLEKLKLSGVRAVVVDEVDNMLQQPYVDDLQALLQATPLALNNIPVGCEDSNELPLADVTVENIDAPDSIQSRDSNANLSTDTVQAATKSRETSSLLPDTPPAAAKSRVTSSLLPDTPPAATKSRVTSSLLPDTPPTLLCLASATSRDPAVTAFADRYAGINNWRLVTTSQCNTMPISITHGLISSPKERAMNMLKRFLNAKPAVQSAIIFVNDPKRVMGVVRELEVSGLIAAPLHGETNKDDRKVRSLLLLYLYITV